MNIWDSNDLKREYFLKKPFSDNWDSKTKNKLVSIIVLNWNGKKLTKECLESVKANTRYKNYEVIVIDNGSTDGSIEMLEAKKEIKLIKNKQNKGVPFANNQGTKLAKGHYCYLLNNDTIVLRNWLTEAVIAMESNKKNAVVGSKLVSIEESSGTNPKERIFKKRLTVCSAGMLFKKEVFNQIGEFDHKNFSPLYGDETDWCYRVKNKGFRIIETNASVIIHLGSSTTAKEPNKAQYELLNTHRLKAMLFNLSITDFSKHIPGMSLILLTSFREKMFSVILKSYWNNLKNFQKILQERQLRKKNAN